MNEDNVRVISVAIPDANPVLSNKILNLASGLLLSLMSRVDSAFEPKFLNITVKDTKFVTDEVDRRTSA